MAINHAVQTETVQRFLLTSERFLLLPALAGQTTKHVKRCVPSCVPPEFASEWVDPIQFRIDRVSQSSFWFGAERKGGLQ